MTKIMENPKAEDERTTFTPGNPWRLTVRGYVIWSSTSCGLRPDQSVKTITWLSLRSGMASIGACSIAHIPQAAMPIQSVTTRNRLRSETSISRSIMDASQVRALDDFDNCSAWVPRQRVRSCPYRHMPNARKCVTESAMKGFTGIRVKCTAQCNEPDPANDGICNADVYPHQKLLLFPFGSTSDPVRRHAVRAAEF